MVWYIYVLLGILLRRQVFNVNDGNDDWQDLIHPEKYGLEQTQNFYIQVELKNKNYSEKYFFLEIFDICLSV